MVRFLALNISTIFIILFIECYAQQDSPKVIGGYDQTNGIALDTSGFRFNGAPLNEYPGVTFQINTGCSPSAPNDNLAVRTLTVPALEYEGPALRTWRQGGRSPAAATPQSAIYLEPKSGNLVYGSQQYNKSQRAYYVAYDLIIPNAGDPRYQAVLADFIDRVQAMVSGKPVCNTPIAAAQNALSYLQSIQAEVSGSPAGSPPSGQQLAPSGCIQESDANYKGDLLSDVLMGVQTADACCQACKAKQGCNVFVYCPAAGSCDTGGGKFLYQGCQLKRQPALNASSQPEFWGRGPGTGFTSGRVPAA
ncbi:g4457 [Coccomyxa elongata]